MDLGLQNAYTATFVAKPDVSRPKSARCAAARYVSLQKHDVKPPCYNYIASCLLLHPVLLCFLSSVCMLYVYGCFGEINYDDKTARLLMTNYCTCNKCHSVTFNVTNGERAMFESLLHCFGIVFGFSAALRPPVPSHAHTCGTSPEGICTSLMALTLLQL